MVCGQRGSPAEDGSRISVAGDQAEVSLLQRDWVFGGNLGDSGGGCGLHSG